MIKSVSIAALLVATASASFAGSLNTQYEAEPEQEIIIAPVGSSAGIGAPAIIGGVLAAAAVAALVLDSDGSSD